LLSWVNNIIAIFHLGKPRSTSCTAIV